MWPLLPIGGWERWACVLGSHCSSHASGCLCLRLPFPKHGSRRTGRAAPCWQRVSGPRLLPCLRSRTPAHPSPAPQAAGTSLGPLHHGHGANVLWPRLGRAGSSLVWVCSVRQDTQTFYMLASHPDMRRDVQEIFRLTPHEKQCMMFSATLSKEIRPVCRKFMQDVSRRMAQLAACLL